MIPDYLLEFIEKLSEADTKTLSQKTLKLFEEGGELAKRVLPFENAAGTKHRFETRESIIEEVADAMLVLLSIGHDVKMTRNELNETLYRKAKYWHLLQTSENIKQNIVNNNVPFEVHVTVDSTVTTQEKFIDHCKANDVKPVILQLEMSDGTVVEDWMTSSIYFGDNRGVMDYIRNIEIGLKDFRILRSKIETVPWHPMAPSRLNQFSMSPNCYFESHVRISYDKKDFKKIQELIEYHLEIAREDNDVWDLSAQFSTNLLKQGDDAERMVSMVTLRTYEGVYEDFLSCIDNIHHILNIRNDMNILIEKENVEFAIHDTNIEHDNRWLNQNKKNK